MGSRVARERKRIARLLITDVTLARTDVITVHVRLRGGQDHTLTLPLPLAAWQIRQTPPEVVAAIDALLDDHTDAQIAAVRWRYRCSTAAALSGVDTSRWVMMNE